MMLKPKIAAVSVRKIFDPNVTGTTPFDTISSTSSSEKSPSGPMNNDIFLILPQSIFLNV